MPPKRTQRSQGEPNLIKVSTGVDPEDGDSAAKDDDRYGGQEHQQRPAPPTSVGGF